MATSRWAAALAVTSSVALLTACQAAQPAPAATVPSTTVATTTATATSSTTSSVPATTASTSHTPAAVPPFVDQVRWVAATGGRSLRVYPTAAGRDAQGAGDADEAWSEVLRRAPDADQPGMRAQFDCHWTYARLVAPDKPSWNLEPWRPVVSSQQMVDAGCNPGGPESAES